MRTTGWVALSLAAGMSSCTLAHAVAQTPGVMAPQAASAPVAASPGQEAATAPSSPTAARR